MKRHMIITAHLDDFEIGMGGTATKLCMVGDVYLVVLCQGDRPGHEYVGSPRRKVCVDNCNEIGIKDVVLYNYSDTKLDTVPQTELCNLIHENIQKYNPTTIYTHNCSDIHKDHRIVSSCVRVAARMRRDSPVDELFEFSVPGSTEWSHEPISYNAHVDISETRDVKNRLIEKYTTEVRPSPDPISIEMIKARDMYHGSLCGYDYAESFKIIFMR